MYCIYVCVYVCTCVSVSVCALCATGGEKVLAVDCRKWLSSDGYFTVLYLYVHNVICRYSLRCFASTPLLLAHPESRRLMTSISLATPFPREPQLCSVSMPTTETLTTGMTRRPLTPTDLVQPEESEQIY